MNFFVYIIQNLLNNKVYIGKTNNFDLRLDRHFNVVKNGKTVGNKTFNLIHKAISKYGKENFIFQVIEEFVNEKESLEAEKFWIEFFRSNVSRFGSDSGYNLTDGGEGISGFLHSEETKMKISSTLKGRGKGRKFSLETRRKQSLAHKGKSKPYRFNLNTKIIWPADLELKNLVVDNGLKKTGKILGVSDNAVRGRLKRRNLL